MAHWFGAPQIAGYAPQGVAVTPQTQHARLDQVSLQYQVNELAAITNNFAKENELGAGTSGAVYKGTLKDGTEVAVKMMTAELDASGFEDEVRVLSKFRHPNIVILMGFAKEPGKGFLLYEFLDNGDLRNRLTKAKQRHEQDKNDCSVFPAAQRLNALIDIACGLSHLHNATPKAFHRDIKAANILMDKNGTAKLADFGLACLSKRGMMSRTVKDVGGTPGYACPKYIETGRVTEHSEVFSFGMLMIEMVTSLPPAVMAPQGGIQYMAQHLKIYDAGGLERIEKHIDMSARWPPALARQLLQLALQCVRMHPIESRPLFTDLLKKLRELRNQTPEPSPARPPSGQRIVGPVGGIRAPLPNSQVSTGARGSGAGVVQSTSELDLGTTLVLEIDHGFPPHEVSSLSADARSVCHKWDGAAVTLPWNLQPFCFGRQHQRPLFEKVLRDEHKRTLISRTHLELSLTDSGIKVANVGSHPIQLNGQRILRGESGMAQHGTRIVFLEPENLEPPGVLALKVHLFGAPKPGFQPLQFDADPYTHGLDPQSDMALALELAGPNDLPVEQRLVPVERGGKLVIGRNVQMDLFDRLCSDAERSYISREHFELRLASQIAATVKRTTSNPVYFQRKQAVLELNKDKETQLSAGDRILLLCGETPQMVTSGKLPRTRVSALLRRVPRWQTDVIEQPPSTRTHDQQLSRGRAQSGAGLMAQSAGVPVPSAAIPVAQSGAAPASPKAALSPKSGVPSRSPAAGASGDIRLGQTVPGGKAATLAGHCLEFAGQLRQHSATLDPADRFVMLLTGEPVVLGRAHQPNLFQKVLSENELSFVSREHVTVTLEAAGRASVKRLSMNPVFVRRDGQTQREEVQKGHSVPIQAGDSVYFWAGEDLQRTVDPSFRVQFVMRARGRGAEERPRVPLAGQRSDDASGLEAAKQSLRRQVSPRTVSAQARDEQPPDARVSLDSLPQGPSRSGYPEQRSTGRQATDGKNASNSGALAPPAFVGNITLREEDDERAALRAPQTAEDRSDYLVPRHLKPTEETELSIQSWMMAGGRDASPRGQQEGSRPGRWDVHDAKTGISSLIVSDTLDDVEARAPTHTGRRL